MRINLYLMWAILLVALAFGINIIAGLISAASTLDMVTGFVGLAGVVWWLRATVMATVEYVQTNEKERA